MNIYHLLLENNLNIFKLQKGDFKKIPFLLVGILYFLFIFIIWGLIVEISHTYRGSFFVILYDLIIYFILSSANFMMDSVSQILNEYLIFTALKKSKLNLKILLDSIFIYHFVGILVFILPIVLSFPFLKFDLVIFSTLVLCITLLSSELTYMNNLVLRFNNFVIKEYVSIVLLITGSSVLTYLYVYKLKFWLYRVNFSVVEKIFLDWYNRLMHFELSDFLIYKAIFVLVLILILMLVFYIYKRFKILEYIDKFNSRKSFVSEKDVIFGSKKIISLKYLGFIVSYLELTTLILSAKSLIFNLMDLYIFFLVSIGYPYFIFKHSINNHKFLKLTMGLLKLFFKYNFLFVIYLLFIQKDIIKAFFQLLLFVVLSHALLLLLRAIRESVLYRFSFTEFKNKVLISGILLGVVNFAWFIILWGYSVFI
ncbi:hypothetical protein PS423_01905 [Pediococcus acidilactici]|uniref:hypothetical protein n=1 Tax=Pediococcus acidilactici TaxID=1254 RepID=UPI002F2614A7